MKFWPVVRSLLLSLLIALLLIPLALKLPLWNFIAGGDVEIVLSSSGETSVLVYAQPAPGGSLGLPFDRAILHGGKTQTLDIHPPFRLDHGLELTFSSPSLALSLTSVRILKSGKEEVLYSGQILADQLNLQGLATRLENGSVVVSGGTSGLHLKLNLEPVSAAGLSSNQQGGVTGVIIVLALLAGILLGIRGRIFQWGIVVVLVVLLAAPWLLFDTYTMYRENRRLADFPDLSWKGRLTFDSQTASTLREYVRDRLGMKSELVELNSKGQYELFGYSRSDTVLCGTHGWFYHTQELDRDLSDKPLSESDKTAIHQVIRDRSDFTRSLGIPLYVLICPDKHDVVPEELGPGIRPLNPQTRKFRIIQEIRTAAPDVTVVWPLEALRQTQKVTPVYYKTDTHWNNAGAEVGAQELLKAMAPLGAKLSIPHFSLWPKTTLEKAGDLGILMDYSLPLEKTAVGIPADTDQFILEDLDNVYLQKTYDPKGHRKLRVFMVRDSFTGFLVGQKNSGQPQVWQPKADETPLLMPFVAASFGESEYLWGEFDDKAKEKIRQFKPDVVVWETVGRFLPLHFGFDHP